MEGVSVGTCGWSYYDPPAGWQQTYESKLAAFADAFDLVEVNRTFYSLPQVSTAERWLREAREAGERRDERLSAFGEDAEDAEEASRGGNPEFTFTVKAWQALTHPISSPTWGDDDGGLSDDEREDVGYLRPNETVLAAWEATKGRADALEAPVVLLQTPPSFDAREEYAENLRGFVDAIDRDGLELAWEPRGDWPDHPDWIADLCDDLDLIHVTDPVRQAPQSTTDVAYCRLHGLNEDRYDYDYEYGEAELADLADRVEALAGDHEHVYCLFNNYGMDEDAHRFRELLG